MGIKAFFSKIFSVFKPVARTFWKSALETVANEAKALIPVALSAIAKIHAAKNNTELRAAKDEVFAEVKKALGTAAHKYSDTGLSIAIDLAWKAFKANGFEKTGIILAD